MLPYSSSNLPKLQCGNPSDRKSCLAVSIWFCFRWGLQCHLCYQRCGALLPHHFNLTCALKGHRRYIFCCTFRQVTLPGRYPAPCFREARTFLVNKNIDAAIRPSIILIAGKIVDIQSLFYLFYFIFIEL